MLGIPHQLHGAIIHIHMRELHIRVIGMQACHHLTPEPGRLQNIGLINGTNRFIAFAGHIKGDAGNALNFRLGINQCVESPTGAIFKSINATRLTKIDTTGQLPHHKQVQAFDHFTFERGSIHQSRENPGRAKVGIESHAGAEPQQGPFRSEGKVNALPLRSANSTQQYRIGVSSCLQ